MRQIRPPEPILPLPADVFLAGGITNCPDWQELVVGLLQDLEGTLYNPRRLDFKNADAIPQIKWEFEALQKSNVIFFWFPQETVCPITLYELGRWVALAGKTNKELVIGCHPNYSRILDVRTQTSLARPGTPVYDNLEVAVSALRQAIRAHDMKMAH